MTDLSEREQYTAELLAASDRATGGLLPAHLTFLTERHILRLEALLEAMRSAGVDEDLLRHSVREVIVSYEASLVEAVLNCPGFAGDPQLK